MTYIMEQVQRMVCCWHTVSDRNNEIQSYVCNKAL